MELAGPGPGGVQLVGEERACEFSHGFSYVPCDEIFWDRWNIELVYVCCEFSHAGPNVSF